MRKPIRFGRGLFDPKQLSRRDHPAESHQAAVSIVAHLPALQKWVMDCVRVDPGLTVQELAAIYCPTDQRKIGRRLNECVRLGIVRRGPTKRCSRSGRMAATWFPV